MIEVTSRRMDCTLLTSNYSQMPAVALQLYQCPIFNLARKDGLLIFDYNTTDWLLNVSPDV